MAYTPQNPDVILNKIAQLVGRISSAKADRDAAIAAIDIASLEGAPINGSLLRRDEASAKIDSLTREVQRLEEEELPRARQAEERAVRARALAASRELHARRVKVARKFDAAAAKAAEALSELMAGEDEYARAMTAAGLNPTTTQKWPRMLTLALWSARASGRGARLGRWRSWTDAGHGDLQPALAVLLGLPTQLRSRAEALAEQFKRLAPPPGVEKHACAPEPGASVDPQFDPFELPAAAQDPLALSGDRPSDAAMAETRERKKAEYTALERRG